MFKPSLPVKKVELRKPPFGLCPQKTSYVRQCKEGLGRSISYPKAPYLPGQNASAYAYTKMTPAGNNNSSTHDMGPLKIGRRHKTAPLVRTCQCGPKQKKTINQPTMLPNNKPHTRAHTQPSTPYSQHSTTPTDLTRSTIAPPTGQR